MGFECLPSLRRKMNATRQCMHPTLDCHLPNGGQRLPPFWEVMPLAHAHILLPHSNPFPIFV